MWITRIEDDLREPSKQLGPPVYFSSEFVVDRETFFSIDKMIRIGLLLNGSIEGQLPTVNRFGPKKGGPRRSEPSFLWYENRLPGSSMLLDSATMKCSMRFGREPSIQNGLISLRLT